MIDALRHTFEKNKNPQKAVEMARYMKNHFLFFGIQKPSRQILTAGFVAEAKNLPHPALADLARQGWEQPEREFQYAVLDALLAGRRDWPEEAIALFEALMLQKSWWDTLDILALKLAATWFVQWPAQRDEWVLRWSASGNRWLIRAAILFQLQAKEKTDAALLRQLAEQHAASSEFFIQKAIGWAFRQYARTDPAAVQDWVDRLPLAALSRREALKRL